MTREEAIDEYHAAIQDHKVGDMTTKIRVYEAHQALMPFLERSGDPRFSQSALPMDLIKRFKEK